MAIIRCIKFGSYNENAVLAIIIIIIIIIITDINLYSSLAD
jgi:hypothetical protein